MWGALAAQWPRGKRSRRSWTQPRRLRSALWSRWEESQSLKKKSIKKRLGTRWRTILTLETLCYNCCSLDSQNTDEPKSFSVSTVKHLLCSRGSWQVLTETVSRWVYFSGRGFLIWQVFLTRVKKQRPLAPALHHRHICESNPLWIMEWILTWKNNKSNKNKSKFVVARVRKTDRHQLSLGLRAADGTNLDCLLAYSSKQNKHSSNVLTLASI